jgi:hypothetical protein
MMVRATSWGPPDAPCDTRMRRASFPRGFLYSEQGWEKKEKKIKLFGPG